MPVAAQLVDCPAPEGGYLNKSKESKAGTLIREIFEELELCVADTYYKTGPTFYGNNYRSNIDHIVVPNTFRKAERILFIKVFEKEGSILQLPKTQKRLDHRPLVMKALIKLNYQGEEKKTRWDRNLMVANMLGGGAKKEAKL